MEAMKRGATDYVLKQRLLRLPGVVRRALAEAAERAVRRRAEAALREIEERVRLAQDAGRLGLWDWDIASGAVVRSDGYYRVWGLDPARFAPGLSGFLDPLHPDDRNRVKADLDRALTRSGQFNCEFRVPQPDGSVRWIETRGEVRFDAGGAPVRMLGVCFDVSARKQAEERLQLLAAEVDHRAKNMLAVVQVMLRQTRAGSIQDYVAALQGRVAALARAHTLLSEACWDGAELRRIVAEELAPWRGAARVQIEGPAVTLNPRAAQSSAMALHELATNAAKYGALSVADGRLAVRWTIDRPGGRLVLFWEESGGPPAAAPDHQGLGSVVLRQTIEQQLGGRVEMDWRPDGLRARLTLPLDTAGQAAAAA